MSLTVIHRKRPDLPLYASSTQCDPKANGINKSHRNLPADLDFESNLSFEEAREYYKLGLYILCVT